MSKLIVIIWQHPFFTAPRLFLFGMDFPVIDENYVADTTNSYSSVHADVKSQNSLNCKHIIVKYKLFGFHIYMCLTYVYSCTHHLILGTCDIAGCIQKVSQNQPVQPVAIYVC